jgi:prepilin-type processing-associated H-X9-DG protein
MDDKPGFRLSLVDTLVAVAVVFFAGALLAMFVPRVGSHRVGRNTQCKNNMRQIAIAADSYQNSLVRYPGRKQMLNGRAVPWAVAMLPQFERLDLFEDWVNPAMKVKPTPFLDLLVCPQNLPPKIGGPVLSYVANAGIADLTNTNVANGVFFNLTAADAPEISGEYLSEHDGTSTTILFSENLQATSWDSLRSYDAIFVWHATMQPTKDMRINGGDMVSPVTAATARPSSKHRGGANVAFADTHVIFLKETIDYCVYMQLMTPSDKDSDMPIEWRNSTLQLDEFR